MDTSQTLLSSEPQPMKSMNDMIGDTLATHGGMIQNNQEEVKATLRYNPLRMMPENSTLLTLGLSITPPTMFLPLDSALVARQLQQIRSREVDYQWPRNLGRATVVASQSIFDKVWNSPEEDEAWRDL